MMLVLPVVGIFFNFIGAPPGLTALLGNDIRVSEIRGHPVISGMVIFTGYPWLVFSLTFYQLFNYFNDMTTSLLFPILYPSSFVCPNWDPVQEVKIINKRNTYIRKYMWTPKGPLFLKNKTNSSRSSLYKTKHNCRL